MWARQAVEGEGEHICKSWGTILSYPKQERSEGLCEKFERRPRRLLVHYSDLRTPELYFFRTGGAG